MRGFFTRRGLSLYTSVCIVATMLSVGRTNIEIDNALVNTVMNLYRLRSKREAVDFALRELLGGDPMTREEALAMRGSGWDGDLDELRAPDDIEEW